MDLAMTNKATPTRHYAITVVVHDYIGIMTLYTTHVIGVHVTDNEEMDVARAHALAIKLVQDEHATHTRNALSCYVISTRRLEDTPVIHENGTRARITDLTIE
jgi:hypothetical protein